VLVIRDVKSRQPVAYESVGIPEGAEKGPSALVIGTLGTERVAIADRAGACDREVAVSYN
jgi:hypothetical protein